MKKDSWLEKFLMLYESRVFVLSVFFISIFEKLLIYIHIFTGTQLRHYGSQ